MKRYRLREDKRPLKLPVVFSSEITKGINAIAACNKNNIEGLSQWRDYLDGIKSYLSNPAIAWDYANRYTHYPNGATYLQEVGYEVSFVIKTSKSTNQSFVYVFKANLNPENFGLKVPATMNESLNRYTDESIDRRIRRLLGEYASRNALITESRGKRVFRLDEQGMMQMIRYVMTRLNEDRKFLNRNKKFHGDVSRVGNRETYRLSDLDELMEYAWLKPNLTGLRMDIFVDDGGAYMRGQHQPLIFVRNGYGRGVNEFIPVSISPNPMILDKDIEITLSSEDIHAVKNFIRQNYTLLMDNAEMKLRHEDFYNSIRPIRSGNITRMHLNEMARVQTAESGLPMDIWVDEGGTFQGHAPRLKFKASNEQHRSSEYSSMTLTNPPMTMNMPKHPQVSSKDIEALQQFVVSNLNALLALAKGEIDHSFFINNMVKATV